MNVLLATTFTPFGCDGTRRLLDRFARELARRGESVDTIKIPQPPHWHDLSRQMLAMRLLDLTELAGERIDRLITLGYPAHALRHPHKTIWSVEHYCGAYEPWDTPYQEMPTDTHGRLARERLIRSDTLCLGEARRVFAASEKLAERLRVHNGVRPGGIVYPPHPDPELFRAGEFGKSFICSSGYEPRTRQLLAVEAMRYVRSSAQLLLVDSCRVGGGRQQTQELVQRYGLQDRVTVLGPVSEADKASLTAEACGLLCIGYDEDWAGCSTLDAFHSHKPVITVRDAGGSRELIVDGLNGLIVEPDPRSLAAALDRLCSEKRRAREMGEQAFKTLSKHGITWQNAVDQLVDT